MYSTLLMASSSRCLFSLAIWRSRILCSNSSCSACCFCRSSRRFWRASWCGAGRPNFSSRIHVWIAGRREKCEERGQESEKGQSETKRQVDRENTRREQDNKTAERYNKHKKWQRNAKRSSQGWDIFECAQHTARAGLHDQCNWNILFKEPVLQQLASSEIADTKIMCGAHSHSNQLDHSSKLIVTLC